MTEQYKVAFNGDQYGLYELTKKEGLTSQKFPDFVKDAFHDKIDDIRAKRGLPGPGMEKVTMEVIEKATKANE